MIVFTCSQCGEKLESPESEAGKTIECSVCQLLQRIPRAKVHAQATLDPKPLPALAAIGSKPPSYSGARLAAMIVRALGWVDLVGGAAMFLVATTADSNNDSANKMWFYVWAGASIGSGVILLLIGLCADCIRDVAINTWHIRNR